MCRETIPEILKKEGEQRNNEHGQRGQKILLLIEK
jgi:hypothetical protein